MTDKKLLELAAKAAGYDWQWLGKHFYIEEDLEQLGIYKRWNPLTDDGDALRLAVKLRLDICIFGDWCSAGSSVDTNGSMEELLDDPYAATRRAIVRAAAEIGKEMK